MEFFINQNSTMPYLELELLQDGFHDKNKFVDEIQNAIVNFSMQKTDCGTKAIICRPMDIEDNCNQCDNCAPKFTLIYKFRARDTKRKGRYQAKIEIDFLDGCGKLIVPIHEKLYINVI